MYTYVQIELHFTYSLYIHVLKYMYLQGNDKHGCDGECVKLWAVYIHL